MFRSSAAALAEVRRRTDCYRKRESLLQISAKRFWFTSGKMAAMKTWGTIWCVASAALGIVTSYGQAHAQASGCVVVDVAVEDQEAFTHKSPPVVDKLGKETEPRGLVQQDATAPLVGLPFAPRHRRDQRGTADKDDAMNISTREKAFASEQSLADYCNLKIERDTKR